MQLLGSVQIGWVLVDIATIPMFDFSALYVAVNLHLHI